MPCYLNNKDVNEIVSRLTSKYNVKQDNDFIDFLDKNMTIIYDDEKKDHETVERGVLESSRINPKKFEEMLDHLIFIYSRKANVNKDELRGIISEHRQWYSASVERESESSQQEIAAYS